MFQNRHAPSSCIAVAALALLIPTTVMAVPQTDDPRVHEGERIGPESFGQSYSESMADAEARFRSGDYPPARGRSEGKARVGKWVVPSRRSTFVVRGEHAVINKSGDTRMAIGFPDPVDLHGAFIAGQGAGPGVWAKSLRVTGFRKGEEVGATDWFAPIEAEPKWFEMAMENVDRVVFEAVPAHDGAGFYSMDDLTFTVRHDDGAHAERTVLDFEDLSWRTTLTGSKYGNLIWESGAGIFPEDQGVHAPIRIPDPDDDHPDIVEPGEPAGLLATAPELLDGFQGIIRGEGSSSSYPPDTHGAVGPDHFVVTVNRAFAVYDKVNGNRLTIMNLGSFLPGSNGDPRVLFDQHSGRWVVIVSDFSNEVYLAVSHSDNAMGTWFKTSVNVSQGADAGCWPDYPTLGVDADGIYVGSFMVGCGMSIFAIEKAPLIDGSPSLGTVTAFRGLPFDGAIQPAHTYGDSGGQYFISRDDSDELRLRQLSGPITSPTLEELGFVLVPGHAMPPDVPSLGSNTPLDGLDHRLQNAVYRDGYLWTTHAVEISDRAAVRWYQIDVSTELLAQWGSVSDPVLHYWMPSIGVNSRGDMILGFSGAYSGQYAARYYTGRAFNDDPGATAPPALLRTGNGPQDNIDGYGRNRWGDYSFCSLDPDDELTMWTIQEYAHSTDIWGTHIGKLAINPAPTNDTCAEATLIGTDPVAFSTVNASTDGLTEPTECSANGDDDVQADVWFRGFALCDGTVTFAMSDLDYEARMAVYFDLGCPGGPDEAVACVQAPGETSIEIPVGIGQAFRVRIGGLEGTQGTGTLQVECTPGEACPADCGNGDGMVDVVDLLALLSAWGPQSLTCDIAPAPDGDGNVDVQDLLMLLAQWGPCP